MRSNTSVGSKSPIRVFLVDDHEVARKGMAFGMEEQSDLVLVAEASSGAEAITRMQQLNGQVDVIVMDAQMASPTDGLEAAALLHAQWPDCQIVLLTSSERYAAAARRAGARGYVLKGTGIQDIIGAIRSVNRGVMFYEVEPDKQASDLTDAELKILRYIANSMTILEISEASGWSASAVNTHLKNIVRKLGAAGREQAVLFALRQGLIQ